MRETTFTGERIHAADALFAVDLARHRAAYELARRRAARGRLLDLGCGAGYGAASLAGGELRVFGLDRVLPDAASRQSAAAFVCGELEHLPFPPGRFDWVVCFQVIEHFDDPGPCLAAIAALLAPGGEALLTTPNRLCSDGVNPHHRREYTADELAERLRAHFRSVELRGIGASEPVRRYLAARERRVRAILRLDPLRLRERLPRPLLHWLFARFARALRRRAQSRHELPEVSWRDYPVGEASDDCLDLLALCRGPR